MIFFINVKAMNNVCRFIFSSYLIVSFQTTFKLTSSPAIA